MKQQIHEITVCGIEDKLLESLWSHVTQNGKPDIQDDGNYETGPLPFYAGHTLEPFNTSCTATDFKSVMHMGRSELFVKKSQFILGVLEAKSLQMLWH